jgi:alkanesulfonate monooxygenase SsuD/methylene tetrahydromethanopterin reductase-like flavin-dependent oxidoreductase (luciferase family)
MKFGGMVDSERLDYKTLLSLTKAYERGGFDYAGMFDHFVPIYSGDDAAILECWTTLGALARDTSRLKLGPLVSCSSYRSPLMVAKMAATLYDISQGRHFLGVGLGWYQREFDALQTEMLSFSERLEQTGEFVETLRDLWNGKSVTHSGKYYNLSGVSAVAPKRDRAILVLIGSEKGGRKILKFIARFADIANIGWNMPLGELEEKLAIFDSDCREAGRDPSKILKSTNFDLLVGANQSEFAKKVERTEVKFRPRFGTMGAYKAKIAPGLVGTPEECAEKIDRLKSMGIELIFLQPLDSPDLDSVELFARSMA